MAPESGTMWHIQNCNDQAAEYQLVRPGGGNVLVAVILPPHGCWQEQFVIGYEITGLCLERYRLADQPMEQAWHYTRIYPDGPPWPYRDIYGIAGDGPVAFFRVVRA